MNISYLYVNIYEHPTFGMLLYAGSCTRADNLPNKVNPTYKGSSTMVTKYGWDKYLVAHCFIRNTNKPLIDEGILIKEMCEEYGILPLAKKVSQQNNNFWPSKFKNGIMLNCHCNTLEHAHQKRRIFGSSKSQKEHSRVSIKLAAKVSAFNRKGQVPNSQLAASFKHQQNVMHNGLSPKAKQNLVSLNNSHCYDHDFQQKVHRTRAQNYDNDPNYGKQRLVKCLETGDVGTAHAICSKLNLGNIDVSIRRHLNRGDLVYKHVESGFTFMFV